MDEQSINESKERILELFSKQKENLQLLKNSSVKDRIKKLKSLKKAIFNQKENLQKAIYKDFKKPFVETDIQN